MKPDIGFVTCIEAGTLERQALLLLESIRRYTGSFKDCALYALSPRAGYTISAEARRRLDDLEVHYTDTILNVDCPQYGSANRVAAAAYIEERHPHQILVILDSDTLFLREPDELILPCDVDVAVRPVDIRGISTSGLADPSDTYWQELCRCCGVDYDTIPWIESFVDRCQIKANYNGGLVVVRGGLGILRRWADFFFSSLRYGLRPPTSANSFRTGVGPVQPGAAKLWGSNQAALALAIWSTTRRVRQLPPTYNYPLHLHDQIDPALARAVFPNLVHVHYHWLLEEDAAPNNPLFLPSGPLSTGQRDWLAGTTQSMPESIEGQRIVCVLGMHQSGTSLIARAISLLGVDLGITDESLSIDEDNVTGFGEHQGIVAISEQILARYGGSWDASPRFPLGWERDPGLDDLRHQARAIIEKFAGSAWWSWMDPRMCLTLPFWQALVTQPIAYIICLRSPVDVAASLEQRNGFAFEKSVELWGTYTQSAIEHTAFRPQLFVFYEDFLRDEQMVLRSLAQFLGKSELAEHAKTREAVQRLINSELQHHQTTALATLSNPRLTLSAKALYAPLHFAFSRASRDGEDSQAVADVVSQYLSSFKRHVDDTSDQANEWKNCALDNERRLTAQMAEITTLQAALREREAQIELMHQSTSWRVTRPLRIVGDALRERNATWLTKVLKLILSSTTPRNSSTARVTNGEPVSVSGKRS